MYLFLSPLSLSLSDTEGVHASVCRSRASVFYPSPSYFYHLEPQLAVVFCNGPHVLRRDVSLVRVSAVFTCAMRTDIWNVVKDCANLVKWGL